MADVKISGLPASTTPLAGTEVLPIVQGGATKQVSIDNVTAGRTVSMSTLGVGTTTPATYGAAAVIGANVTPTVFIGTTNNAGSFAAGIIKFGSTANSNAFINYGGQIASYSNAGIDQYDLRFYVSNGAPSVEKMRIHYSGGVSIGNTTDPGAGSLQVNGNVTAGSDGFFATTALNQQSGFVIQGGSGTGSSYTQTSHAFGTASGNLYAEFMYATGAIGSITQNGTTGVLYNIVSDQRLKKNIVDAPSSSSDIDAIKVRSFDFISDSSSTKYGFIAQELEVVAPYAVYKPTDESEIMGVDYSKLVPLMIKEIQSLRARLKAANIE